MSSHCFHKTHNSNLSIPGQKPPFPLPIDLLEPILRLLYASLQKWA